MTVATCCSAGRAGADESNLMLECPFSIQETDFMKRPAVAEIKCPACEGTGLSKVKQPVQPGRKIYPVWAKDELNRRAREAGIEMNSQK
jgi:hypothetical protein